MMSGIDIRNALIATKVPFDAIIAVENGRLDEAVVFKITESAVLFIDIGQRIWMIPWHQIKSIEVKQ